MNDLQKTYIRNQILTMPMKVTQEITHKNKKFNKRSDYDNIINYIDNFIVGENLNRFLVLPGLRDVGKTTILYQVYEYLQIEKNISPQNILYFSCDRLKRTGNADIFDVVSYYCESFQNSLIETLSSPVFLLIDEAQYDQEWALNGKLIFDATKNIFMILSGSSALKLSSNPDAARRLLNIPIYPLSYSEHLKLKYKNFKNDISPSIIQMIFNGETQDSAEIERKMINIYSNFKNFNASEWKYYLQFGGFPSSFYQNTNEITKKISNQFDAKKPLVSKVLDILEKTQLIFHIEAFTSSVKRTTKPHEYFFATPSLKHNLALDVGNALLEDETAYFGKLLESYVASSFHDLDNKSTTSLKTYYDDSKKRSSDKNVDFIVQRGLEKPIPIEISCGDKDKSQIKRAIKKYKSPHGIIISNTTQNIVKNDNIIRIPPEIFAFM